MVFGAPIYFGLLSGQFTLFVDRMYSLMAPQLGKLQWAGATKALLVVSQGAPELLMSEPVINQFYMALKFLGFNTVDPIINTNGGSNTAKENAVLIQKAMKSGKALVS